jgi:hypothetical protein
MNTNNFPNHDHSTCNSEQDQYLESTMNSEEEYQPKRQKRTAVVAENVNFVNVQPFGLDPSDEDVSEPPVTEDNGNKPATRKEKTTRKKILSLRSQRKKSSGTRGQRRQKISYNIPSNYKDLFDKGLEDEFLKLGLHKSNVDTPVTGDTSIEPNSIVAYEKHARLIRYFCAMTGDYQSCLSIAKRPPKNFCPSMWNITLKQVIDFKRNKKGDSLLHLGW